MNRSEFTANKQLSPNFPAVQVVFVSAPCAMHARPKLTLVEVARAVGVDPYNNNLGMAVRK